MKKFSKIVIVCLMAITVISFTYQTSFGAQKVASELNVNTQISEERVELASAVGLATLIVGAAYATGYALGRAYGHRVFGSQEEVALVEISVHNPNDFSTFDN